LGAAWGLSLGWLDDRYWTLGNPIAEDAIGFGVVGFIVGVGFAFLTARAQGREAQSGRASRGVAAWSAAGGALVFLLIQVTWAPFVSVGGTDVVLTSAVMGLAGGLSAAVTRRVVQMGWWHRMSEGEPVTRRRFLLGAGAGVAGAGLLFTEGVILEPTRLSVSRHTIGRPGSGVDPIRLAVLTDLHLKHLGGFHQRIAQAVVTSHPDAVLFVGDSIDDPDKLPLLRDLLEMIPGDAVRFATLGNWEYWSHTDLDALRRVYEAGETRLLVNEAVDLQPGATLFGLDDFVAGQPDLSTLPAGHDADVLLLSHCPGYRDTLTVEESARFTAMISGHTHGGQIAIGGWAPIRPPGSGAYVSGWYRGGGPDLFVSRGLGTSLVPIRLGSVPELAIVDWYPATPDTSG
jgi:predicted MPP superfamily phosphohydrolase